MRLLAIVLVACSAPARSAPAPASAPPPRDLAIAEPPPRPAPPPPARADAWIAEAEPRPRIFVERPVARPREIDVAERDLWTPCVRAFVEAKPPEARRALTAAFARYPARCDAEQRIVIDAPPEYRERFVVLRGTLANLTLDVVTCGTPAAEAITIAYDRKRWTGMATTSQLGACAKASVPDMPSLRRALREATFARDATVNDVAVSDEMKRDLGLVLDALDALSAR